MAPTHQGAGIGSALLRDIIQEAESQRRILCLETSAPENVPWYQKFGFTAYNELDLGYTLHFLRRDPLA